MNFIQKLNELSKIENNELENEIEKAEQEYKKIFGNNDYTNVFDDDATYLEKLKKCIGLKISYDRLYTGDLDEDTLI